MNNYRRRYMYLEMNYDELSEIFVNNLLETNRGFDFYVNWENARAFKQFEIELNAMNVLIKSLLNLNGFLQSIKQKLLQ